MRYKIGQVAETTTWIVATLIILFILIVSVYAASLLSTTKIIKFTDPKVRLNEDSSRNSLFAFLLTKDENDGKIVFQKINEGKNLDSFSENLGKKIFGGIYEDLKSVSFEVKPEDYFDTGEYGKIKIDKELELRIYLKRNLENEKASAI